jgi:hypothetical protein
MEQALVLLSALTDGRTQLKTFFTSFALVASFASAAQNLVPNPDFERYDTCPSLLAQMHRADDWSSLLGTCEYFNACGDPYFAGVPINWFGYQEARSGVGYAGLFCYTAGDGMPMVDGREYMGAQLMEPLVVGQQYHLILHASMVTYDPGDGVWFANATNRLGMLLTMEPFLPNMEDPRINHSQLFSAEVITESIGWHTVEGVFVADSAYEYVAIGNFFSDDSTATEVLFPNGVDISYYFVDDVCVAVDPSTCFLAAAVQESAKADISAFPNPFLDRIDLTGLGDRPVKVELSDLGGRIHASATIVPTGGGGHWYLTGLAAGQYLLTVYLPDGSRVSRPLQHLTF